MVKGLFIEPKWISENFLNGYYLNKLSHSIQKMTIMELSQMCGLGVKKYKQHTNVICYNSPKVL